jgi:hypothetical protein
MSGRAIIAGILGTLAIFALMFWNGAFMYGDPVEPPMEAESTE